jgi:2-polyprenyl-6-methoxyphenol hydroxylase-like FAD-dependent oxidoreductase
VSISDLKQRPQVIVVGGGPVGLALSLELGWRGVRCLLLEQGDGTIVQPKMNEVNARTMEFCRRWGIVDDVLNCPFPADFPLDSAFVTSLFGYELGRVERPARAHQTPDPHSPYRLQACSQFWFDPILQRAARSYPSVTFGYRCRVDGFEQDHTTVTVRLTNLESGAKQILQTDYLVGCDGATSRVREALGIRMLGKGTISYPIHTFFRAPRLLEDSGRRLATFYLMVDQEGLWGNLRIIDPASGFWRLMVDRTDGTLTPERVDLDGILRRSLGRAYQVEWLGVNIWHRRSLVAEHYGQGRVFLAGDAVHQLSPTGALGMNSGVGDAVDLGWKLAAVVHGWGGSNLLASYDAERQPIGLRNVRIATDMYHNNENFAGTVADLERDDAATAALRKRVGAELERVVGREFRTIGAQLGYRYDPSPICVADGTPAPPDPMETYVPTARPGSRAPHAWLADGRSTLDLFGRGFTLLRFTGSVDTSGLHKAAAKRGVPLSEVALDDAELASLYERSLVLVRPDGHVAWRGDALPIESGQMLDQVTGWA